MHGPLLCSLTPDETAAYSPLRDRAQPRKVKAKSLPPCPVRRAVPVNEREETPGSGATFALAPGVRLEPLGDGSAVLYSRELDQSLSLNHTAALLCSFADGRHTVSAALREIREVFPHDTVEEAARRAFVGDRAAGHFLQWT